MSAIESHVHIRRDAGSPPRTVAGSDPPPAVASTGGSAWCVLLVLALVVTGCDAIISITGGQPSASFSVANGVVDLNARVELDATASEASHGPLRYRWTLQEKPPGSGARIRPSDSVEASLQIDRAGEYRIRLEVTDYHGRARASRTIVARDPTSGSP